MPPSDQPWSEPFAEGILKDVQKSLINTKKIVSVPVNNIKTQYVANLTKVKKSIKKSEYGVIQSEEHCQEVQLDTSKAKNDADKRYSDAIDKKIVLKWQRKSINHGGRCEITRRYGAKNSD